MENPRESEGEGRKKIMSGDRISALPDGILHQILPFLPSMEEAARTSVLSKRWRHLWTAVPFVDRFLLRLDSLLPKGQKIRSLHLPPPLAVTNQEEEQPSAALHRWVLFAANRGVEELVIHGSESSGSSVEIPNSLYECRSLRALKIRNCFFPDKSVPIDDVRRFRSLNTVSLCNVDLDDSNFYNLEGLWSFSLRALSLIRCRKLDCLSLFGKRIVDLAVRDCDETVEFQVVRAPCLRRLVFCGSLSRAWPCGTVMSLEEAHLLSYVSSPFPDRKQWKKFISSIAHVKILSVNSWFFQFSLNDFGSRPPLFTNLNELHFWAVAKKSDGTLRGDDAFFPRFTRDLTSCISDFPSLNQFSLHFNENMMETQDYQLCLKIMSDSLGWRLIVGSSNDVHDRNSAETYPPREFDGLEYSFPQLKVISVIKHSSSDSRMVGWSDGLCAAVHS